MDQYLIRLNENKCSRHPLVCFKVVYFESGSQEQEIFSKFTLKQYRWYCAACFVDYFFSFVLSNHEHSLENFADIMSHLNGNGNNPLIWLLDVRRKLYCTDSTVRETLRQFFNFQLNISKPSRLNIIYNWSASIFM